jgi:general secretion pathway protein L
MSLLVILLPPRDRLGARGPGPESAGPARLPAEWEFVLSTDGRHVDQSGRAALALLPRAETVVLLLADADVSWHRVDLPRAPAARLRAALAGVMEEALLDDDEALHLALGPGAVTGRPGWVAATHRPYLITALTAIEGAGRGVASVVCAGVPGATGVHGHFHALPGDDQALPWLTLAGPDGVASVRLSGGLARALLPASGVSVRWTAVPAVAAAAERWLGAAVPVLGDAERALEAAHSGVNLRQFDLVARARGTRALREAVRRLFSREWRTARWGLLALVALQLAGLNAYAWQQRQALSSKRQAMHSLLQTAHPGVRVVLDAPVQMERETDRLRAAAGQPGEADLESMLAAAASAWPDGQGPVSSLRFEPGKLSVAAAGWGEPQLAQFRERLRAAGFVAELADGRIVMSRASPRGTP